jgi:serine protease Do
VEGTEELQRLVRETPAGRQVKLELWRNGAPVTVTATVEARRGMTATSPSGDWPFTMPSMPPMPDMPHIMTTTQSGMLGIEGEALGQEPQFAEFFGVKDGVLVKAVTQNSVAEKAGIKAGDVITRVGDAHVATSRDITSALRSRSQTNVTVTVIRNKKEMALTATFDN